MCDCEECNKEIRRLKEQLDICQRARETAEQLVHEQARVIDKYVNDNQRS